MKNFPPLLPFPSWVQLRSIYTNSPTTKKEKSSKKEMQKEKWRSLNPSTSTQENGTRE